MKVITEAVSGKNLAQVDLDIINYHRKIEFDSKTDIIPRPGSEDWSTTFILAKKENELKSFGRLIPIEIHFRGKKYSIIGIASIVAIEKKMGYGRIVLYKMNEFVKKNKQTAIGFCGLDPDKGSYGIFDPETAKVTERVAYEVFLSMEYTVPDLIQEHHDRAERWKVSFREKYGEDL